jgi:hypothetical protein
MQLEVPPPKNLSTVALRRYSHAIVAHSAEVRRQAETARLRSAECRRRAQQAAASAKAYRIQAESYRQRLNLAWHILSRG